MRSSITNAVRISLLIALSLSPAAQAQIQHQGYQYKYDASGNRTESLDPNGLITEYRYDALNRLIEEIQPPAAPGAVRPNILYGYDGLDQLVAVTDPRGKLTSYTVDGLGNQSKLASPDTGASTMTHDAAGNVLTRTDAKGRKTSYTYDGLYRVTSIAYSADLAPPTRTINFTYDQGTYGKGRLTAITDGALSISYTYTQHGRLAAETRNIDNRPYTTAYSYDPAGRLAGITYPSGLALTHTFDAIGRIAGITATRDGNPQVLASQISYQPFGGVKSYVNGANKTITRSYDLEGRVTSHTQGASGKTLGYDFGSRIGFIADSANPAENWQYSYDGLNRLINATGPASSQGFDYDVSGNRSLRRIGTNETRYQTATASNRLQQVQSPAGAIEAHKHDATGNRTETGTVKLSYDVTNRMSAATKGTVTAGYLVNALGERVQKSIPSGAIHYHYDRSGKLIAESNVQGSFTKEYVYLEDLPVAVFQ